MEGYGPLRRGLQVGSVMASRYMSEGHLDVNAKGAANWLRLMEKVAKVTRVDLV